VGKDGYRETVCPEGIIIKKKRGERRRKAIGKNREFGNKKGTMLVNEKGLTKKRTTILNSRTYASVDSGSQRVRNASKWRAGKVKEKEKKT